MARRQRSTSGRAGWPDPHAGVGRACRRAGHRRRRIRHARVRHVRSRGAPLARRDAHRLLRPRHDGAHDARRNDTTRERRTRAQQRGKDPVDLFEYQGKQYFARFGIPISKGGVADTVDEAVEQAERCGLPGGGQGTGESRRQGEGGRGEARRGRGRGEEARLEHPRPRHQGPRGQSALDRACLGHRP